MILSAFVANKRLYNNILPRITHALAISKSYYKNYHKTRRPRGHPFQLPTQTNSLDECNFICTMLYKCI